ncbi:MAG: hypothetical protein WAX89_04680 [Alphaproteobacteria bacterium]
MSKRKPATPALPRPVVAQPQVAPQRGLPHKALLASVALVVVGVVAVGALLVQWDNRPSITFIAAEQSAQEQPVVARTVPEQGHAMPSTIIDVTPESVADVSITVLTNSASPIVDVTANVRATPEPVTPVTPTQNAVAQADVRADVRADVQAAQLVQATLQLAQANQQQNLRLVSLAMALHAKAPETEALLQNATQFATDPAQKSVLTAIANCRTATPVAEAEIPVGAIIKPAASPVWWPTWWDDTLGRFVTIRKAETAAKATPVVAKTACDMEPLRLQLLQLAGALPATTPIQGKAQ